MQDKAWWGKAPAIAGIILGVIAMVTGIIGAWNSF
jgi:hypothetical protein